MPSPDTSAQDAPVGPYSPAETCASCGHQSFYHGAGAPMCSFMVAEHGACTCQDLRFARAQDAPVASQEAEARRDVYRAFAAHMKVVGLVDPPTAENVPDALDAYAAAIRASERERYAALVEAIIWMSGADDFTPGKPAHAHWIEIRDGVLASALAELKEAGSA